MDLDQEVILEQYDEDGSDRSTWCHDEHDDSQSEERRAENH